MVWKSSDIDVDADQSATPGSPIRCGRSLPYHANSADAPWDAAFDDTGCQQRSGQPYTWR